MPSLSRLLTALLVLTSTASAQGISEDATRLAVAYFDAPTQSARAEARAEIKRAARRDNAMRFLLGSTEFFGAVEGFIQDLNRHGFDGRMSFSLFRSVPPGPASADAEPLDYEGFRAIIERFHKRLDQARKTLSSVDPNDPFKLELGFAQTRLAIMPGETIPERYTVANLLGIRMVPGVRLPRSAGNVAFRYDNADALWLEGYANLLMAQTSFVLAHDFRRLFDTSFHAVFPRSGLPLADGLVPAGEAPHDSLIDGRVFDFVAFIHLIDLEVERPKLRRAARGHLLAMIDLSRRNWAAIEAETDADMEWLPGPQQEGGHPMPGVAIGEEEVAGWLEMLEIAEAVLNGGKLVPHPRFTPQLLFGGAAPPNGVAKGVDMKRFFERPTRFDLVLFITGSGALPYVREGKVVDLQEWRRIRRVFRARGFIGTALWFN